MSLHDAKSPSQADKFANCQGSLALCKALPDHQQNVGGPAAKLGTCVHTLIENCLINFKAAKFGDDPEDYRGRIITIANDREETTKILPKSAKSPKNQFWIEVDDDVIDGASLMVNYVKGLMEEIGPSAELETESRTNPLPDRDDTSGTADVTVKNWPVVLNLVDYKNGWNLVEHFGNKQLLAYLLGKAIESDFEYAKYRITVVQPNAEHEEGKIRHFDATADELREFAKEYRGYVEACDIASDAPGAPTAGKTAPVIDSKWAAKYLKASSPSDKKDHCMFCDAKAVCPAYLTRRQTEASMDFEDEPADLPYPQSEADVARIMRWKPSFDALFRAAFAYGQRSLENGFEVPGFKLSRTKGRRKWLKLSQEEIAEVLMKRFKLARSKIFRDELKTGPQIEKLIPKKDRDAFNAALLFVPEGTLTIVPEEDKRDAVLKHAGDDFDDDIGGDDDDFG